MAPHSVPPSPAPLPPYFGAALQRASAAAKRKATMKKEKSRKNCPGGSEKKSGTRLSNYQVKPSYWGVGAANLHTYSCMHNCRTHTYALYGSRHPHYYTKPKNKLKARWFLSHVFIFLRGGSVVSSLASAAVFCHIKVARESGSRATINTRVITQARSSQCITAGPFDNMRARFPTITRVCVFPESM